MTYQTKQERREQLWKNAIIEQSFSPLIPYGLLMLKWSRTHPRDVKKIAVVVSHKRGIHDMCGTKCKNVDAWIKRELVKEMIKTMKGESKI